MQLLRAKVVAKIVAKIVAVVCLDHTYLGTASLSEASMYQILIK